MDSIVIMGVAGCGKSSLGLALASRLRLAYIEGDEYHSTSSLDKMKRGMALNDQDRAGWLKELCRQLQAQTDAVVMTCSALKHAYRDQLRKAKPGLRFVFLDISRESAARRVTAREASHFFSSDLVDSQFAALEKPTGERGVLRMDADLLLPELVTRASNWATTEAAALYS